MDELICKVERVTDVENNLMTTKGGRDWTNWKLD